MYCNNVYLDKLQNFSTSYLVVGGCVTLSWIGKILYPMKTLSWQKITQGMTNNVRLKYKYEVRKLAFEEFQSLLPTLNFVNL